MKVKDIMNTDVVAVRSETTVKELFALMLQHRISDFPVVDGESKWKGMVYERDLLQALYPSYSSMAYTLPDASDLELAASMARENSVEKIMTREVMTASPEDDIMRTGAKMLVNKMALMPVVQDGKVIGIIDQSGIFVAMMKQYASREILDKINPLNTAGSAESARPQRKERRVFSGAEKRLFERRLVNLPAAYKVAKAGNIVETTGKGLLAVILDISAGGVRLQIKEGLPSGCLLELVFDLSGQDRPLRRLGRVTRCFPAGEAAGYYEAGIMFLAIKPADITQIDNYIKSSKSLG